jgi:hypothetical protein
VAEEGNVTIEKLDKRFCTVAAGKGFITSHQLLKALEIQAEEDLVGEEHRLIGKILFDQGFVTPPQIKEILVSMNSPSDFRVQLRPGKETS